MRVPLRLLSNLWRFTGRQRHPLRRKSPTRQRQSIRRKEPPKIVSRDPNFATLTRDVSVPVLYGVVGIRTGTKVRVVSRTDSTVRIRYDGMDYDIPVAATDAEVKHD
jgi:hypothetical protein